MRDQTRFLRTLCSQVLKISNDGNCTIHCGNLLHWLTVILKKVLFMSSLNLLFGFIVVFSHLPMLHHCENPSSVILINFLLILESLLGLSKNCLFCKTSPGLATAFTLAAPQFSVVCKPDESVFLHFLHITEKDAKHDRSWDKLLWYSIYH